MSQEPNPVTQNELGKALDRGLDSLEKYSQQILGAAIVAAVVIVGAILWYRGNQAQNEAGWQEFLSSNDASGYESVATNFTGYPVADWAHLSAGREQLSVAISESLIDRKQSDIDLKRAIKNLEDAAKSKVPEVKEQALFQLGTAYETDSDLKNALGSYKELIASYPQSPHLAWAKHRVEWLDRKDTKEFYAWFKEQNPALPSRPDPKDTKGAKDTKGSSALPSLDDMNLPETSSSDKPESLELDSSKPAETKKSEDKPADTKAETKDKPAETKTANPAEPAKPAAETKEPEKKEPEKKEPPASPKK